MFSKIVFLSFFWLILSGCSKDSREREEFLKDENSIEIKAQDDYQAKRSSELEQELAKRQRFYQAVSGTYLGEFKSKNATYKIRLTFAPSLPLYQGGIRYRPVEEVTYDLTNLYFNIQIVHWNPEDELAATGCRITNVKPDLITGRISITSPECPNFYQVALAGPAILAESEGDKDFRGDVLSSTLARDILVGAISSISEVQGQVQPTTNATIFSFSAKRVAP